MERNVILALFDREQRIDIEYPGLTKEIAGGVVRFTGPPDHESGNFVLYSRFADDHADEAIRDQISHFRSHQLPFEWKVYDHDSPLDLRERLGSIRIQDDLRSQLQVRLPAGLGVRVPIPFRSTNAADSHDLGADDLGVDRLQDDIEPQLPLESEISGGFL